MKKTQLAQKLLLLAGRGEQKPVSFLIGFDGFTDEIVACVDERRSVTDFSTIRTIPAFAKRLHQAAQKSTNVELVTIRKKVGGNGPILAEALIALGHAPALIGAMGYPKIESIFEPLLHKCSALFSLAASAHTDALEFQDGKILLGKVEPIFEINEKSLLDKIPLPQLISLFEKQDVVASVNWTMVLGTTGIWKMLIRDVLPHISKKKRILFVDLADPEKRTSEDLVEALSTLKEMKKWYTIILGLNEKEGERIYTLLTDKQSDDIDENTLLIEMARSIQNISTFDKVVIHSIKKAVIATDEDISSVEGPYCPTPFLSTGGGDNFNAGLLIGIAQGFTQEESLLLAVATSGFYVRAGKSPNTAELSSFLRLWDRDFQDSKSSSIIRS